MRSVISKVIFLVSFIALLLPSLLFAQQDLLMYNMEVVPQRMYTNPAFKPTYSKVNIGLPFISSEYVNVANSGFTFGNLFRQKTDGSPYIDYENMLNKLAKNNYIIVAARPDLLSFGFQVKKKNYFSFNITEKVDFRFRYPKDFMEFIWKGNGNMLDQAVNLGFKVNFMHYREYGLGFARNWNDKLNVGAKLKYLYGMENVWTRKSDITLTTASSTFDMTAHSNVEINMSGFDTSSFSKNFSIGDYAFKKKNKGLGVDLGGVYKYSKKISFSASVVDFGFIRWNDHPTNLKSRKSDGTFTYKGLPVNQLIEDTTKTFGDLITDLGDSMVRTLKIDTSYKGYTTMLSTKIYLGGNYYVTEKSNAGVLFYSQFYDRSYHPGLALSYNHRMGRWFQGSVSYAMYNRSYTNVGLGIALNAGPVQWYIASDNILAPIFLVKVGDKPFEVIPRNAKNIHIHFGLNLTFGREKKDRDKDGIPDSKDDCPDVPGLLEFHGCPDKDGDKIIDKRDSCPDIAGLPEFNGCPDKDGDKIIDKRDSCPDVAGLLEFHGCPDRDGDKIIDKLDSCPDEAGLKQFFGCPDTDHDGVMDKKDKCPNDSGAVATNGCPDRDGDGILDKVDRCPDKAGPKENEGCPLAKLSLLGKDGSVAASVEIKDGKYEFPATLQMDASSLFKLESYDVLLPNEVNVVSGTTSRVARKGADSYFHFDPDKTAVAEVQVQLNKEEAQVIKHAMETLEFDSGSDVIRASSLDGLDLVGELLRQNPTWKLKLSGHTDNKSSVKFNMNLSKKRVEAIRKYLGARKGIAADRFVLKWYGPTKPIATNDTEEGRQKNRRVEFLIIQ